MYKKSFMIVKIAGAALMLLLALCALADTWYMLPGEEEVSLHKWDSVPGNILGAVLCCILFFGALRLEEKLQEKLLRWISETVAVLTTIWTFVVSMWWIFSAKRLPLGDQAYVYGGASYFSMGNFSFLEKGGYCHLYPYQLGLTSLIELLYHVVEPFQYRPLQVINALAAAGTVYVGYRLVKEWQGHFCAAVMYCILIGLCFPLLFYTPWVYGDIISAFLAILGVYFLCCYEKRQKARYLAGLIPVMTLAQLVRQSTTIVYIALCLVALAYFMKSRDKKLLVATIISVILPLILFAGIYKIYEVRSGIEQSKGVPTVVTLAMGMQESRHGCGWDNNYQRELYGETAFDTEAMQKLGWQELKERVRYFADHPMYAAEFYGKKILSQWNAPLYQSVYFTADYSTGEPPKEGSLAESVSGQHFWQILNLCDRLQFVVYLGMLFWYLLAVREEEGILRQLPAAAVIGGFCFSLLWEAKTRYILPYYLFMFPCAAIGYREFCLSWRSILQKYRKGL